MIEPPRPITRQQFLRITAVAGVSLTLGGGLIRALVRRADLHEIRETRTQMGTLVTISVVHPSATAARGMVVAAFAEMERLEAILSRHREGTPVSRLNAEGVVRGAPTELTAVVRKALHYSALSDGAFDITVAPLLELYASSFALTGAPPSDSRVEDIRSLVGHRDILVDDGSIAFKKPGMSITLDGIAKGHIVDRAVSMLRESGAEHVLVDAGGDMASVGEAPSGDGWRIAIQDPRAEDGYLGILQLRDNSVATSGDYLEYFAQDKRSHHTLDTLQFAQEPESVPRTEYEDRRRKSVRLHRRRSEDRHGTGVLR